MTRKKSNFSHLQENNKNNEFLNKFNKIYYKNDVYKNDLYYKLFIKSKFVSFINYSLNLLRIL